jgi:hypothetical protein
VVIFLNLVKLYKIPFVEVLLKVVTSRLEPSICSSQTAFLSYLIQLNSGGSQFGFLLTIIELSVSIALELTIRHTAVIVNRKNRRIVMLYDRATDVTVRSTLLKTVLTPTKCTLIVAIYSVNVLRPTMKFSEITYTRFEKEDRRRWKTLRINRKYQI